ncbi:toxin biosynthesis ketoreductase protein [Rutstroemia sp. NJR-2017a BVV2]|nr:toxin biosynthesis ketoreductase protein [Rutstroemia sp. NJR-2017a BVV2]
MSENITYFITGANKGIGHNLTRALLLRPSTTIIATTRTPSPTLSHLPTHPTSTLIPLPLTFTPSSLSALPSLLAQHGIQKIHILILNAGQATSFHSVAETSLDEMREHFEVNTLFPVALWQVLRPFFGVGESVGMEEGKGQGVRKIIYISSSLGSIAGMESGVPSLAYGVSKAGGDYFVRKVHFEEEGVVSLALHPGWVKTDNGQAFADSVGISEPPMT